MKKKAIFFSSLTLLVFCSTISPSTSVIGNRLTDLAGLTIPVQVEDIKIGVIFEDSYYYHNSSRSEFLSSLETVRTMVNDTLNMTIDVTKMNFTHDMFAPQGGESNSTGEVNAIFSAYTENPLYEVDVIIAVGRDLTVPVNIFAGNNNDKSFLLIDKLATIDFSLNNTAAVIFNETEGAFLAGVAAASQIDSSVTKFGIITDFNPGSVQIGLHTTRFITGFSTGVQYIRGNQQVDLFIESLQKDPYKKNDLTDVEYQALAKEKADEMFSIKGVGAILAATGNGDAGIYLSAEENDRKVIGMNGNEDGESTAILTSIVKNFTAPLYDYFSRYDELKNNGQVDILDYGIANNGVMLSDMTTVNETEMNQLFKTENFLIKPYELAISPGFEWISAVLTVCVISEIWRRKRRY